jgi:hypothetical protein
VFINSFREKKIWGGKYGNNFQDSSPKIYRKKQNDSFEAGQ